MLEDTERWLEDGVSIDKSLSDSRRDTWLGRVSRPSKIIGDAIRRRYRENEADIEKTEQLRVIGGNDIWYSQAVKMKVGKEGMRR